MLAAASAELEPCAQALAGLHGDVARLSEELDNLQAQAPAAAAALDELIAATASLRELYALIDVLERNVATAGRVVEAAERRLVALQDGPLPPALAQLPTVPFSAGQFVRQLRAREVAEAPALPELELLPAASPPGSDAASADAELQRVVAAAAEASAAAAARAGATTAAMYEGARAAGADFVRRVAAAAEPFVVAAQQREGG